MQRALMLVVVTQINVCAITDKTGIRFFFADDELNQRGFSNAVRSDERNAVTCPNMDAQIAEKVLFTE